MPQVTCEENSQEEVDINGDDKVHPNFSGMLMHKKYRNTGNFTHYEEHPGSYSGSGAENIKTRKRARQKPKSTKKDRVQLVTRCRERKHTEDRQAAQDSIASSRSGPGGQVWG